MNESAKKRILQEAAALGLDAAGIVSFPLSSRLKDILKSSGSVPFAPSDIEERLSPEALLPGARSAIVILFPYKPPFPEKGNLALYARGRDYHHINHHYLSCLEEALHAHFPDASFYPVVDTSPMVDRFLAWSAGLGFYGKNHCLINETYGSWFTIGALLTTLPLEGDSPLPSRCGACRRCLDACPGRALTEEGFHPWRCKSWLTQKKEDLTEEEEAILRKTPLIFGCDACQGCCPFNDHAAPSPLPEMAEHRIPSLSRDRLNALSNRAFTREYKDYAFSWRGKKILLRNLSIIEKN